MNKGHRPKPLHWCAHSGRQFAVNPRLGKRHGFCSRPACAQASRRVAQQKWLKRTAGKGHFCGWENVARVREWRKRHPQYWKKTAGRKARGRSDSGSRTSWRRSCAALRYKIRLTCVSLWKSGLFHVCRALRYKMR